MDEASLFGGSSQLNRIERKLDRLMLIALGLKEQGENMATALQDLQAQVAAQVTVEQSAITLISGLATQITNLVASGGTPAQFTALAQQLKTSADALAAAVLANTTPPVTPPTP